MPRALAALPLALALAACERAPAPPGTADARPPEAVAARVEARVEEVDRLRVGNAATLAPGGPVTRETFEAVCRPVGARVRAVAAEEGWAFRQLATRNRNPAHYPDPEAEALFERFEADPALRELWLRAADGGAPGYRYLRRIDTQGTCLACHGAREERPAFVVEGYPEDRGYGFAPGELRGLYSVFVPDSLAALALLPARGVPAAP